MIWAIVAVIALLAIGFAAGFALSEATMSPQAKPPSPIDVGFCQDMSVHHAQAVEMATAEVTGGADPAVKNLAFDILTTQQNQIGRMQGWLTQWGQPLLPANGYMGWMATSPASHHPAAPAATSGPDGPVAVMPGMATSAELARLRNAAPAERDVLFLELMLRHHRGGTGMLALAADKAEAPYVRDLARQMLNAQNAEIMAIEQLLRQKNPPMRPPG